MELSEVVPWGRSFEEYRQMFCLTEEDLGKRILGCGDGPACFNAELTQAGGQVVSADPVYQFSAAQIRSRIQSVYPQIMEQVTCRTQDFVWKHIRDPQHLGETRMNSMNKFLEDYEPGCRAGRYIEAGLPQLPFDDKEFDLALCSHYLFLYSEQVDYDQHIQSMRELCRVATEVRVYPLLSLNNEPSPHVQPVLQDLNSMGIQASLSQVPYEFQNGATQMLLAKC